MGSAGLDGHSLGPACFICEGDCQGFPDIDVHDGYPFLTKLQKDEMRRKVREREGETKPTPVARRRGRRARRAPDEDRAHHGPAEDR